MARFITSFFGLGWIRPGPGTWGSLGGLVFWSFLLFGLSWPTSLVILIFVGLLLAGHQAILIVEKELRTQDAGEIVIDEVLGIFFPVLWSGGDWRLLIVGFVLFRLFDIFKPVGVKFFDQRHLKGWGVILDDIVAGLYAGALVFAINTSLILSL